MTFKEQLEVTVEKGSDSPAISSLPSAAQKDEVIFCQTESHSSAGGLIEVDEWPKTGIYASD